MLRVYLKVPGKRATNTVRTTNIDGAKAAFAELVNRTDLDSTNTVAVITRHGSPVAHHIFNALPGSEDYWRGRVVELQLHQAQGRPVILKEGKRFNVYLDAESMEIAKGLGAGNVSDGIRKALQIAK